MREKNKNQVQRSQKIPVATSYILLKIKESFREEALSIELTVKSSNFNKKNYKNMVGI